VVVFRVWTLPCSVNVEVVRELWQNILVELDGGAGRQSVEPLLEHADAGHRYAIVGVALLEGLEHDALPELDVVCPGVLVVEECQGHLEEQVEAAQVELVLVLFGLAN
jgi:hypothetical protein